MKKGITIFLFVLFAFGCRTTSDANGMVEEVDKSISVEDEKGEPVEDKDELYLEADETTGLKVVEVPVYYPVPEKAYNEEIVNKIETPNENNHGEMQWDYISSRVYEIHTSPLMSTDIRLKPGEEIMGKPIIGDTMRWEMIGSPSYENNLVVQHIILKPHEPFLKTSLVIMTNQRTYNLILRSFPDERTAIASWRYPMISDFSRLQQFTLNENGVPTAEGGGGLDFISFDYRVTRRRNKKPIWYPENVYDDGRKTYIVLPDIALQTEVPSVMGEDGEILNPRRNDKTLVLDGLFEQVELVNEKDIVIITKIRG